MKKKARWSLAAVERKGMRSKPPRCPLGDGRPRGAEGRWVRRQETEMDLTETYMKRLASCTSHVGKNEGACVPRWRGETRRGRLRAEGRRLLSGNRGRPPKDAAMIEQVRHRAMGSAGVGGAAAAVGKRRRERDAELQIQAPRLTVRR